MARDRRRRVRLRDVAERAGVSVGSASQAFGHPERVSQGLRERVLAAAEELGYTGPDPAARRLRMGRTGVIGLIFAERLGYQFTDPAAPAFFRGVSAGMRRAPLALLLLPDSRRRDEAAATVRDAAVDGFVVYSVPRHDPRLEAALARRVPVVTVDQPRDAPTSFVGIDDRGAARSAARHLRELGHERIGVLSFVSALDAEGALALEMTSERLAGYEDGLAEAWDPALVRICRPNAEKPARAAALELLREPRPPTAILAMSDVLAIGALHAAAEAGCVVPRDLSIVGFDDSPPAAATTPPLTSVAQPHEEKGRLATVRLLDLIEGAHHGPATRDILPTELVVRGTTAPPPALA